MNGVFYAIVALAIGSAILLGTPGEVGAAALDSAKVAVELAIGLVGYIALFLGLMKIVEEAGGLKFMAKLIEPVLTRIFPDVPPDHPAMGAMVMNIAANALGLGNAATPFGLKAMQELNELNKEKGTATNAMVLFLAINTSGLALLPTGIIGLRALKGSADPAAIFSTTLIATGCSTLVGIMAAKLFSRLPFFAAPQIQKDADRAIAKEHNTGLFPLVFMVTLSGAFSLSLFYMLYSALEGHALASYIRWGVRLGLVAAVILYAYLSLKNREKEEPTKGIRALIPLGISVVLLLHLVAAVYVYGKGVSDWIIPILIFGILTLGIVRRVKIYEVFITGAKEGFSLAIMIIPYLVAILSAVGMFRKSGGLAKIVSYISPITETFGLPAEVLPLAFLRPLSGSGAYGITAELITTHGPDSYIGNLVSTMNGSTETTFYVLAVYFGSVGVTKIRHAVPSGLAADMTGVFASVAAVYFLLGH